MYNMKTVGVIGGLGPETTAEFYLEVVFGSYKKNREERPPILVWNVPLKYSIEKDLLLKSEGEERYIPYLLDAAKGLERAGADFLVMPCNSLHTFIGKIREAVSIPVLSIVEETARFLKGKGVKEVGILATSSSLKRGLYESVLGEEGIKQVVPDDFEQAKVGKTIEKIVLKRHANKDRQELIRIIDKFEEKGLKIVILACTDLQLLIPQHPRMQIIDTMKILAEASVREILGN
jgi:aspartate racemase